MEEDEEICYKEGPVKEPGPEKEITAEEWTSAFAIYKNKVEESISKFGSLLIKDYVFLQPTDKWGNEDLNRVVLKFQSETNGILPIWRKKEKRYEDIVNPEIVGHFTNLRKYENFKGKGPSVVGDVYLFKEVESPFFSACYLSDFFERSNAELKGASVADDVLTPIYKDRVITHLLNKTESLEKALKENI